MIKHQMSHMLEAIDAAALPRACESILIDLSAYLFPSQLTARPCGARITWDWSERDTAGVPSKCCALRRSAASRSPIAAHPSV